MKKIAFDEMSREGREAITKNIYSEAMFFLTNALFDNLDSDKAFDAIRPYARMSGHAVAINMITLFGIEGSDIEKIADVTELFEMFSGNPTGTPPNLDTSKTPNKIIRAGYMNCLNATASKEFCIWGHEMMINGICEAINPEYECKFTQMITRGDPICSYVIEKKKK